MSPRKALLTGATGFVGGSVLAQLASSTDPNIRALEITALVRRQDQAELLAKHGIRAELFNGLDDAAQLRRLAAEYDVVLHCATGLHTASAEALVLGLGDAVARAGRPAYYIHTTGTSNLADSTLSAPDAPLRDFSDADNDIYAEDVRREAQQVYPQRTTDIVVVETAEKTGVTPYIMMPPTIYGKGLGLFNTQSMQVPSTIRHAIDSGYPEYIGTGTGTVGYVHVADLARLYELLLGAVLAGKDLPSGRGGFYFSNTGAFTWKDLNEKIGAIGQRLGALKSPAAVSVSLDEAVKKWGWAEEHRLLLEINHAGQSQTTAKRAYQLLGWEPKHTSADWDAQIEEAWKIILAERDSAQA